MSSRLAQKDRSRRILLIDNDTDTLARCKTFLSLHCKAIVTVSDSLQAMGHLLANVPDLVLVEMVMAGKDGIELLLTIKQTFPQTKVIAMSGGGSTLPCHIVLRWARQLGADAVLAKPFCASELQEAVQTVFSPAS